MVSSLSKLAESEFKLFGKRFDGRRIHGVVKPVHKIAVGKEIQAKHGGEHGERPRGLGEMMKPFEQEHGNLPSPEKGKWTGWDCELFSNSSMVIPCVLDKNWALKVRPLNTICHREPQKFLFL